MRAVDVSPEQVTTVLITHAHVDHIGGMLDKATNVVFPNAQIYIHYIEDSFWRQSPAQIVEQAPHLPFELVVAATTATYELITRAYGRQKRLINDGDVLYQSVE